MSGSCIDLTGDLDEVVQPAKRQRVQSDEDSEFLDCEIVSDAEVEAGATAEHEEERLGDDIAVTGTFGQIWNIHLPHKRYQCGKHPYKEPPNVLNVEHCPKCYCYICDCLAPDCKHWGSGHRSEDHCNAKDAPFYENLKKRKAQSAGNGPSSVQPPRSYPPRPAQLPAMVQQKCTLSIIPDPSEDKALIKLGEFTLRCKAVRGKTIAGLKANLAKCGYFQRTLGKEQFGSSLCLENLFDKNFTAATSRFQAVHLKLKKLPLPAELENLSPMRVRKVTVSHFDGRSRATTYGVTVKKDEKVKVVMEEVMKVVPMSAEEMLLPMSVMNHGYSIGFLKEDKTLQEEGQSSHQTHLVRVRRTAKLPNQIRDSQDKKEPRLAVISHEGSRAIVGSFCQANGTPWMSDGDSRTFFGTPIVVALEPSQYEGGAAAARAVTAAVLKALKPYLKDPTAGHPSSAFKLFRRSSSYASCGVDFKSHRSAQQTAGLYCTNDDYISLTAFWSEAALESYDVEALCTPVVDDSATDEAMKETVRLVELEAKRAAALADCKAKTYTAVEELASAARDIKPVPANPRIRKQPMVRVITDLEQTGGAEDRNGVIRFTVFALKSENDTNSDYKPFFKKLDSWPSTMVGNRRHYSDTYYFPLGTVMDFIFQQQPGYIEMRDELRDITRKDTSSSRSIQGVMQKLVTEEREEAEQPEGLTVTMRSYQKQSLKFMLDSEKGEGGFRRHMWFKSPGGSFWYSPLLQRACLHVPAAPWGGFLAEEMGLGKTVEIIALTLANPSDLTVPAGASDLGKTRDGLYKSRATLVVCPVSLVGQWMSEANAKLNGTLRIHMYHGQNRIRNPQKLANEFDLVVTTYATLAADYNKDKRDHDGAAFTFPPLGCIKWHRLVLDESHTVKNLSVAHTKASVALQSDRRWCCTGTPIGTAVDDLLGQFGALHMEPFSNSNHFNGHIKPIFTWRSSGSAASLLYILGKTMVRHTKLQVLGGEEVLKLPPKTEELVPVIFTREEQRLYKEAHEKASRVFSQYRVFGAHNISKHLLRIMSLLQPMRRICSGGQLTDKDLEVPDLMEHEQQRPQEEVQGSLVIPQDGECSICLENLESPVRTPCQHWFCRECITSALNGATSRCPLCRAPLSTAQLLTGVEAPGPEDAPESSGAASAEPPQARTSDSKLRALLRELRAMREADSTAKALIFSQYVSTIEWLKLRLQQEGFGYRFISGSMPLMQRTKAIEAFQKDPPTTVFLLSIRSGSVGINLTAASHVFLLEPALNPALEEQAIGRSWRMGQMRSVTVKKFYVKGSVEERIMEVVKGRQDGSAAAGQASITDELLGNASRHGRQVTQQDLAGSIRADRQNLKLAELEVLFKAPEFKETAPSYSPDAGPSGEQPAATPGGRTKRTRTAPARAARHTPQPGQDGDDDEDGDTGQDGDEWVPNDMEA